MHGRGLLLDAHGMQSTDHSKKLLGALLELCEVDQTIAILVESAQ